MDCGERVEKGLRNEEGVFAKKTHQSFSVVFI
jgi:hypothetical protein